MKTLKELSDLNEIQELRYKFAKALDNQDWNLFQSLLNDKLDIDYSNFGIPQAEMTNQDYTAMMQHSFSTNGLKTEHFVTNMLIDIQDKSAKAEVNVLARHIVDHDDKEYTLDVNAYYEDEFIETDKGWKFNAIKINPRWITGDPSKIFTF
ncbi:nuclear transport factor 2 family protein [Aquimarina sp. MMG016]|uniref:nuclear transport factor 2 family protein n=1 Tax=Aquimarina sp. MMG016 TaxID=2822690 RepID=UPI001B3A5E2F|nr:nuclear transport factor 2 family protein [Aquimarina sp. MMG016]MBQ4819039.1 nuclear transport factor 2 family protein [Aquimarina sp. MMG016]